MQVNVTVLTPLGQPVTSMEKEHFRLFEDKAEQTVLTFSSEEAPLSVGLVFDISGSMGNKLQRARQAAAQFFRTANPDDEFFLVQFNERPEMAVAFTTNTEEIQNRMLFTQAKGRTALLDGIYLALAMGQWLPVWLVALVIGRDLLIVCGVALIRRRHATFRPKPLLIGKLNTFAQLALAACALAHAGGLLDLGMLVTALIVAVSLTTLLSGAGYAGQGLRALQRERPS